MRLHTDTLTDRDIYTAASVAGPDVRVEFTRHGSRKRDHAFNVSLTGTSTRRPNSGNSGAGDAAYWGVSRDYAATWDEWGMFFAELFRRDADMIAGNAYDGEGAFQYATDNRYDTLKPSDQHRNHRWVYARTPREFECKSPDCDAIRRA